MKSEAEDPPPLPVIPVALKGKTEMEGYKVLLPPVDPEKEVKLVVEMVLIKAINPFPKEITQVCTIHCG